MIDLLTLALAKKAGGGGGTSDYTELTNKPSINGVTLTGNKSAADIGLGKYGIELLISQDMQHLTDIQHDGASMTFAELKTAIETKDADIFIDLGGNIIHFTVQQVGMNNIIITSNLPSPLSGLQAVIRGIIDSDVSKSNFAFIDIANTPTEIHEQTAPTSVTLADNTDYYLTDVSALTLTYPSGRFECFITLSTASSGSVSVTFPAGTQYIGAAPVFGNDETWEISIKNGIVVAVKVGDGT